MAGEPEWSADMLALQGNFPKKTPAGGGSRRKTKPGSNARVTMDGYLLKEEDDEEQNRCSSTAKATTKKIRKRRRQKDIANDDTAKKSRKSNK